MRSFKGDKRFESQKVKKVSRFSEAYPEPPPKIYNMENFATIVNSF